MFKRAVGGPRGHIWPSLSRLIILGDFNVNYDASHNTYLSDIMCSFSLSQVVYNIHPLIFHIVDSRHNIIILT